jgi:hypothetical protein
LSNDFSASPVLLPARPCVSLWRVQRRWPGCIRRLRRRLPFCHRPFRRPSSACRRHRRRRQVRGPRRVEIGAEG